MLLMNEDEFDDSWDDIAFAVSDDGDIKFYFANNYFYEKLIDRIVSDMDDEEIYNAFFRLTKLRNPDVFDRDDSDVQVILY